MDKIQYCLKEILLIKNLLEINNSGFYKRLLSRVIAIRIPDFIKFSFAYNKSLPPNYSNKQKIKNELNGLDSIYKEFMKTQRDKLGAHFQDLDLFERIELWLKIDFETIIFFINCTLEIYEFFSSSSEYKNIRLLFQPISQQQQLIKKISEKNNQLDIENNTYASSDILGMSRFNTSQAIFGSEMNNKSSILKSIEIILNYDLEMMIIASENKELSNVFKEMFINDVINYYDNLITRVVKPGALQEMDGFDKFVNDNNYPEANKIINDFKINFKDEYINNLRNFRNKLCSHIDDKKDINNLLFELNNYKDKELILFYSKLKNLFKKICFSNPVFIPFRNGPVILRGISAYSHYPEKSFDNSKPKVNFEQQNYNDLNLYDYYYQMLIENKNYENTRYYFYRTFTDSDIVKEHNFIRAKNESYMSSCIIKYRRSHEYFSNKLIDPNINDTEKEAIIKLFCDCKTGYPNILTHIILQAYPIVSGSENLANWCIYAFGELDHEKIDQVFRTIEEFYDVKNGTKLYQSLLALLKIDIKVSGSLNDNKNIEINDNKYSLFIKEKIDKLDYFLKISLSIAFVSEIYFTQYLNYYAKIFEKSYIKFFKDTFKNNIENFYSSHDLSIKKERFLYINTAFNNNDYTGVIILITEDLQEKNNKTNTITYLYNLVINNLVKVNEHDNYFLNHIGYIFHNLGENQKAIEIFRGLVDKNPDTYEYHKPLLGLYKAENMINELNQEKNFLLLNYNLKDKDKKYIEDNF